MLYRKKKRINEKIVYVTNFGLFQSLLKRSLKNKKSFQDEIDKYWNNDSFRVIIFILCYGRSQEQDYQIYLNGTGFPVYS